MKKLISLIIFLSFLIPNLKAQDADVDTLYLNDKIIYKGTTFLDDSLDMNTNRIKNLVAALDLTDAINLQQLMDSLGTFELDSVSSLDFYRGIDAPAHREGRLFYDTLTKALSYYTDEADITLNIGQESWIRVYNNSGGLIEDGKVVYIDSASQDHPEIELARANAYVTSRTIGVATHDIEDGTFGYVTSYGIVRGLSLAGCTEGAVQYLDAVTAGELTETMPTGGDFVIQVGVAVDCDASGSLLVYSRTTEFTAEMILKSGFPFQPADSSNMSFSDANRYFKIEPAVTEFYYYDAGIKYIKSEADSIQITDVEGIHLIYYVNDVLTITVNPTKAQEKTVYLSYSLVSDIYWDATNNEQIYFADERHFFDMPCITHWYLHDTQGAKYLSGLALTDILADESGALDTHAQFGIDAGAITDEDYQSNLDAIGSTTGTPVYWRTGASGDWRLSTNAGFSVLTTGTGRLAWNEFTGGAWQQTEVTNGSFVLAHTFATNKTALKTITIMGQNEYSTISLARTGIATEINTLELAGLPFEEAKSISSVIYETKNTYGNAVKARIRTTVDGDDYQDWRESVTTGGGSGSGTSTTFLSLTDVPNTYAGDGDKLVGVNNAESGLEFIDTISIQGATFATNVDILGDLTLAGQFAINTTLNAGFIGELQVDDTDNKSGLLIDFNETGAYYGLEINSESTTREALYAHGKFAAAFEQDLSNGSGLYVKRDIAEAGSASLVEFIDDNVNNTQATLTVRQDGTGNILELADGGSTTFTLADGGLLTNVGATDLQSTLTLSKGSQDYLFGDRSATLYLKGTSAAASTTLELVANDNDGTDDVQLHLYGNAAGAYPTVTNREKLIVRWNNATTKYEISTEANGSGTLRPLSLFTEGNTDQLTWETDGDLFATGKFGLGITPAVRLDVQETSITSANVLRTSNRNTITSWEGTAGVELVSAVDGAVLHGVIIDHRENNANRDILQLHNSSGLSTVFKSTGNVSIGSDTDTHKLHVTGTTHVTGNTTLADQLAINTTINASYQMALKVDDADNKGGLLIDMDETGAYPALRIDGSSTAELNVWSTGKYAGLFTQTISDGYGLFIDRDIAEAGSNPLVTIRDDNAATTQPTLRLRHDGTGNIFEALDGTSTVFTIADGGNTTITGNLLTGTHNTYDIGLTGTRFNHIYVDSAHANHYGNSDFSMSGTGFTITINADSTLVTSSAFGNDWQNSTKILNANSLFDQFVALNTGGNLSNVSYLDAANSFTNTGTNSFLSDISIATGKAYEINGSTILPNTAMGASSTLGATSGAIITYGNTNWGDASSFGSLPFYRGINQQMANYLQTPVKKGNNEFNTGVAGQNYFHAVAIHGDYGYALTREDPSSIIRFELEDLTQRVLFTFPTTGTIYDGGQQIWYSEDLDEMMVVFGEGGEINIATVNLANTSMTLQVTITEAVSELAASGWVISDGFVYLATESVNFANKVYKVDISDWTYSSVTMSGDVSQQSHAMVFDGSHLYVGTVDNSGSNHKLFKLTTALALSDSVTIDGPPPDDIADVGDRVYIALEDASGTINYIDKGNMGKNSLETGESVESFGAFFDGTFIYVVYDTSPGTLLRVNPFDNSIRSMTYPTGYDHPNEFISDGNRYFTTFWSTTARMMRMSIPEFDAEIIYPDLYSTIWGLDSDVEIDNTGIDLGSGIEYQISGTSINTAGTLTNVAYLNQINQFSTNNEITKTGNDTFTYPLRLTNLGTASTDNVTGVGLEFNSTSDITYATVEASVFDETGNGLGSWFVKTRNDSLTEKFRIQGLGDIRIPEIAGSSATPASGYGYIRAETDGLLYWTDDGGTRYDLTAADALPAQSGKNNNFLTTNGTVASWSTTIGSAWTVLDAINFQIGTGGDLKLTHDASNSIIEQISGGTGNLLFKDAGTTYFYMDGATTKTIFSEDLLVQDSDELIVGSGSTMRMYFDGSHSNINYTTGELVLTGVPASDPSVAGAIWSNSGVLTLSSGAPAPNPKPLPTSLNQMQNEIDLLKSENAYLTRAVEDLRLTLETFMEQNKNKN